ncbi:MAG TPA: ribonuclease Z [Gemmatimonadaceae bacterium]|nr:ribonuclease Z [Gemmatimonadaceae bacterium]
MSFTATVLGVGDAFSALHYTSSLLLEAAGMAILVDCPHPIRKMLREGTNGRVDVQDVRGVVVTHLHADHASGLEGFAYYTHFMLGSRTPLIAGPEVLAQAWEGHLAVGMSVLRDAEGPHSKTFESFFDPCPAVPGVVVGFGPFAIEARPTHHHIPTYAFKIRAAGRTVGISGDTAFDEGLIEWLAPSDLIVHEANLGPAHTPYESLAALPSELRNRMRVTHLPDGFEPDGAVQPLVQGQRLEV